eukprot:m51a1_g5140 hypothetical protein (691) ;mRNA; f:19959-22322
MEHISDAEALLQSTLSQPGQLLQDSYEPGAVPDDLAQHVHLDDDPQTVIAITPQYFCGPDGEEDETAFIIRHQLQVLERPMGASGTAGPLSFTSETTARGRLEFVDLSTPHQMGMWAEYLEERKLRKAKLKSRKPPISPAMSDADCNPSTELAGSVQQHAQAHGRPSCLRSVRERLFWWVPGRNDKLGQWLATAIAGNDLLSSILYTAGPCAVACGKLSPIALAIVGIPLFFYRYIYTECILAIPLNGGVYNILLNSAEKRESHAPPPFPFVTAAFAAVLMILSYIATAVVSAGTAAQYLTAISDSLPISAFWLALIVLAAIALLTMLGVRDSSVVSLTMFSHHIVCIIVLVVFGFIKLKQVGTGTLRKNWAEPPVNGNLAEDVWLGFSAAMLGVTGFETSANYIESQGPGVYPKCLRNMWVMSTVQNILVQFLITALVSYDTMKDMQYDLVAALANATERHWLVIWLRVNAGIVCCGGVITAFVGTIGLAERLCSDKVLPSFLNTKNKLFGTAHWLPAAFWALTSALFAITEGNLTSMSGMFTASFLTVLTIVACGNLTLKYKRPHLPRSHRCHWLAVIFGGCFIVLALVGNIYMQPIILLFFFVYFVGVFTVVMSVVMRHRMSSMLVHSNFVKSPFVGRRLSRCLFSAYESRHSCAFFTKSASLSELRKACSYVYVPPLPSHSPFDSF